MTLAAGTDTTSHNDAGVANAARVGAVMLLIIPAVLGGYVAGGALHDPDTCWLLALGRWILEHGRLPQTDPFSYTYALFWGGQPVVLYQWLSELIFFVAYKLTALPGLLALSSVTMVVAFYALPVRILCRCGLGLAPAAGLALLMVLTASFHFLVRPEIFSYLLAAVWIERLTATNSLASDKFDWRQTLLFFALTIIWCNLHSGFVFGLILLSVSVLSSLGVALSSRCRGSRINLTALAALAASLVATLINPWGIGLWGYLPRLFFPAFNHYIVELKPVTIPDLGNPIFWPYLVLMGTALFIAAGARTAAARTGLICGTSSLILALAGLFCRRLVPFAALFILAGLSFMLAASSKDKKAPASGDGQLHPGGQFLNKIDAHLQDVIAPQSGRWLFGASLMAVLGTLLMSYLIIPPQLPQGSAVFQPPVQAINFLTSSAPAGKVLNDAQFGDVMIWHLSPCPPVFLDTRFDMYGDKLVADYQTMTSGVGNWRELLAQYRISWAFLNPECALVKELERQQPWHVIYRDNAAVILSRVYEKTVKD